MDVVLDSGEGRGCEGAAHREDERSRPVIESVLLEGGKRVGGHEGEVGEAEDGWEVYTGCTDLNIPWVLW